MDSNNRLIAAIYMRLSKEDEFRINESNSIRMQRILLKDYAAVHLKGYRILEFKDDGYSGINFNRPGITALLELVRDSAVDCILVKDFSRFSRDYIELGSYINQILPFMGVRFISVNDSYDSSDGSHKAGDLDISFKNLLYDLYSKDLSVKVKASLTARKEKGEYVSANSPFGYEKASDDRHMLLIEEDEARVVRRIFQMREAGRTSNQIAKILNEEGIKTPIQFKIEKGKTYRAAKGGQFMWSGSVVCRILQNDIYIGDIVYGKYEKDCVGGKNRLKPREEWKFFRNHHAPIIDRDIFLQIQQGCGKKKGERSAVSHPLTGKLLCGCCKRSLRFRSGMNPYFICTSTYVCRGKDCVRKVNAMLLEEYVMCRIQNRVLELMDRGEILEMRKLAMERELQTINDGKKDMQKKLLHLQEEKRRLYEKYTENRSDAEKNFAKYIEAKCEIEDKEIKIKNNLQEVKNAVAGMEERKKKQDDFELFSYLGLSELTAPEVRKLIKNIIVYDERHIEINWEED